MSTRTVTLALVLATATLAACGGEDLPTVDCSTPAVPTFSMVNVLTVSCATCHASTLSGAARFGAPVGLDYDTFAAAKANAEEGAAEIFSGSMPPTGGLPEADKQVYYRWALCGTPQ
jgi:hypothetical protein